MVPGCVLVLPVINVINNIDSHIRKVYGEPAKLAPALGHLQALGVMQGSLSQQNGHLIRLKHVFVDMTPAA